MEAAKHDSYASVVRAVGLKEMDWEVSGVLAKLRSHFGVADSFDKELRQTIQRDPEIASLKQGMLYMGAVPTYAMPSYRQPDRGTPLQAHAGRQRGSMGDDFQFEPSTGHRRASAPMHARSASPYLVTTSGMPSHAPRALSAPRAAPRPPANKKTPHPEDDDRRRVKPKTAKPKRKAAGAAHVGARYVESVAVRSSPVLPSMPSGSWQPVERSRREVKTQGKSTGRGFFTDAQIAAAVAASNATGSSEEIESMVAELRQKRLEVIAELASIELSARLERADSDTVIRELEEEMEGAKAKMEALKQEIASCPVAG